MWTGLSEINRERNIQVMYMIGVIVTGFILDLFLGDPHWMPHPVRLMGKMIAYLTKSLHKPEGSLPKSEGKNEQDEVRQGAVLVIVMAVLSFLVPLLILEIAGWFGRALRFIVESIMCYQIIAAKSLYVESMKVYQALIRRDLEGARSAVSMIVGRDTKPLNQEGITKAAVETVAENTSDGVIAPLFFLAIGGVPLGFLYKAINTMDSMVGYKNEEFLFFGKVAAKLDDVVNYIPARLSALLIILSCPLFGLSAHQAWKIFLRDRHNHASPNSAQTESAVAGALDIQLGGDAWYFGKLYHKQTIGDASRPAAADDIKKANHLMYASTVIFILLIALIRGIVAAF